MQREADQVRGEHSGGRTSSPIASPGAAGMLTDASRDVLAFQTEHGGQRPRNKHLQESLNKDIGGKMLWAFSSTGAPVIPSLGVVHAEQNDGAGT